MPVGPFPATLLAASLLGVLLLVLAIRCTSLRVEREKAEKGKSSLGTPEQVDEHIAHAMRVLGNYSEYVPVMLILLALLETTTAPSWFLFSLAGLFILARLMHAYGYSRATGRSFGRYYGTLLTWICVAIASLTGLYFALIA